MAPPIDAIDHFNSWQVPFTIVVAILMALAQFLSYRNTEGKKFIKRISLALVLSIVTTFGISIGLQVTNRMLILLMFASLLTVFANADYLLRILNGKIKNGGASIAHVGFGLFIFGALLSAGLKTTISTNTSGIDIRMKGEEKDANQENILLYKNDTLPMGPYLVTYVGKKKEGINILYEVSYMDQIDPTQEVFSLFPRIQLNKNMGNVPEPDTKHFLTKDLFTHVTYVNEQDLSDKVEKDYQVSDTLFIKKGDTVVSKPFISTLQGITSEVDREKYRLIDGDIAVKAMVSLDDLHDRIIYFEPLLVIRNNQLYFVYDENEELGIRMSLVSVDPATGTLTLVLEKDQNKKEDFIIMKAAIFPYINILWIGSIIMILGTGIAIYHRIKKNQS
jgi:cytochrome c-type biogenesis protein CcmF